MFYVFSSQLDNRKLEQIVGAPQSRGEASERTVSFGLGAASVRFVEIKTPKTSLLEDIDSRYRPETWAVSRELAGTIAQAHRTVQVAEKTIGTRLEPKDENGDPTGEKVFLFRPRSVVVVGSLQQFMSENGVNEARFSSFELFRRQISSPEVMTFDELYERARFIVEASDRS